jgi:hypothetical protein
MRIEERKKYSRWKISREIPLSVGEKIPYNIIITITPWL